MTSLLGVLLAGSLAVLGDLAPTRTQLTPAWLSRPGGVQQILAITVSPLGRAEQCTVVLTSGQQSFDEAVCDAVRRSSFVPARSDGGEPLYSLIKLPLTWSPAGAARDVITTDQELSVAKLPIGLSDHPIAKLALTVDAGGRVTNCAVVESSGSASLDAIACGQGVQESLVKALGGKFRPPAPSLQSFTVGFDAFTPTVLKRDPKYAGLGDSGPYFPERALRLNVGGYAVLGCHTLPDGSLEDCAVKDEAPRGFEFKAAALRMAQTRWMKVAPGAGPRVEVRVDFPASGGYIASTRYR